PWLLNRPRRHRRGPPVSMRDRPADPRLHLVPVERGAAAAGDLSRRRHPQRAFGPRPLSADWRAPRAPAAGPGLRDHALGADPFFGIEKARAAFDAGAPGSRSFPCPTWAD